MADVEAYDISDERIDLGSRVTLPKSWHARVSGEQDVPGTITVRVEWDAALGRTAVVFAAKGKASTSPARCSARCARIGS